MPRRVDWLIGGGLMLLAASFRVLVLARVFPNVDSDQAVVGIMAYHIQAGQHPLLYYGQPYQGSLEAYAAALLFTLFGAGDWTLRLPVLACSALFVGALYLLGATLYGRRVAVLAALAVALGPGVLLYYGDVSGFSYSEVLLLGTVLLILQARHPDLRCMPLPIALLMGLLAGLGLWIEPLMGEYLLALGLAYALPLFANRHVLLDWGILARTLSIAAVGFAIGGAPLLLYNLGHRWATLGYLISSTPHDDHLAVALRLITQALPVLLGLAIQSPSSGAFNHMVAQHPIQYALGLALGLYLLVRLLAARNGLSHRIAALLRSPESATGEAGARHGTSSRDGALALLGVICVLFIVVSHFGVGTTTTARYLLPLYMLTPLMVDLLLPRPGRVATLIAVLLVGALLMCGASLTLATPSPHAPLRAIGPLVGMLERRRVRVAYTDYWIAYRISFESHQRVLGIPAEGLRLGRLRVLSDLDVAAHTPVGGLAWIVGAGSGAERQLERLLQSKRIRASRTRWADLAIYDRLSQPLRPTGAYGGAAATWFE